MPKYYIDEALGSDENGDGSVELPYKSVVGAYLARGTSSIALLMRKAEDTKLEPSTHTPAGTVAPTSQADWHPITTSAQKKGKKLFEQQQKKNARQAELADKEKEKEQLEARKLDEAKKVVLVEPTGEQAKRIKIRQATANRGRRVRIFGWVHRLRQQSALTFITLRDGTGYLQIVLSGKLVSAYTLCSRDYLVTMESLPHRLRSKRTMPKFSTWKHPSKSPVSSISSKKVKLHLTDMR